MRAITITGENHYQARKELRRRLRQFKHEHGDASVVRFEAVDSQVHNIVEALRSFSLLSPVSLVVVETPSGNKDLVQDIDNVLASINEANTLILYEPSIDRRTSFFKILASDTELIDCRNPTEYELIKWVEDVTKRLGGKINTETANFLVDRAGEDQWRLKRELEKLIDFDPSISKENITELVEPRPRETVFQLLDQILERKTDQAINTYQKLRTDGVEPHYIISMLAWQLHIAMIVVSSKGHSPEKIADETKISSFVAKKTQTALKNRSKNDILRIVEKTAQTDANLKRASINPDAALKQLIIELTKG